METYLAVSIYMNYNKLTIVQIQSIIMLNLTSSILILCLNAQKSKELSRIEIFNEIMIMGVTVNLLAFTVGTQEQ